MYINRRIEQIFTSLSRIRKFSSRIKRINKHKVLQIRRFRARLESSVMVKDCEKMPAPYAMRWFPQRCKYLARCKEEESGRGNKFFAASKIAESRSLVLESLRRRVTEATTRALRTRCLAFCRYLPLSVSVMRACARVPVRVCTRVCCVPVKRAHRYKYRTDHVIEVSYSRVDRY